MPLLCAFAPPYTCLLFPTSEPPSAPPSPPPLWCGDKIRSSSLDCSSAGGLKLNGIAAGGSRG